MSLTKRIKELILFGVLALLASSCSEDPNAPLSEKFIQASDNFKLDSTFEYSRSFPILPSVDEKQLIFFAGLRNPAILDTARFSAKFNEVVSWTITIKSLDRPELGPVKVIKGTSDELKTSEVFWLGDSDNVYFFSLNEKVEATLSVLGTEEVFKITDLNVAFPQAFEGVLITDFDENADSPTVVQSVDDINLFFQDNPINEEIVSGKFTNPDEINALNEVEDPSSADAPDLVQGPGYVYLKGQDNVAQISPFFIGGINNSALNFGLDGLPEDWYFNFLATSNGNRNTRIVVDIAGTGGDLFNATRDVTWSGWRLVSVRLSDFIQSTSGALGGNGLVPASIKTVTIGMHSGGGIPGNKAELALDFLIFTKGGPFNQKNIKR